MPYEVRVFGDQVWEDRTTGQLSLPGRYTPLVPRPEGGADPIMVAHTPDRSDRSLMDAPTSVYRYFDAHGVLIYVGITGRGVTRNVEHNKSKPWWQFVASQEVDHMPNRGAALAREARLVQEHCPPFNTQHNPHHLAMRAAYLEMRQDRADLGDHPKRIPLHFLYIDDQYRMVFRTPFLPQTWQMIGPAKGKIHFAHGFAKCRAERVERQGPFVVVRLNTVIVPPKQAYLSVKWETKPAHMFRVAHVGMSYADAA